MGHKKQRRNPLRWPSPALLVTAAVFSYFGHSSALVPNHYRPDYGQGDQCLPFLPCQPNLDPTYPEHNSPPPPISNHVLQPPTPSATVRPAPGPPSDPDFPSLSPPPSAAPGPPGQVSLPVPIFDRNNGERRQQRREAQKTQRSKPNVAATLGWVFLAAALLLKVALGGFLVYKRWELEQYGVRLDQVPANRSPPRPTAFDLRSDREP